MKKLKKIVKGKVFLVISRRRGSYAKISLDVRMSFINTINDGMSVKEAARIFGIKRTTALSFVRSNGELKKKCGKVCNKLTEEIVDFLFKK